MFHPVDRAMKFPACRSVYPEILSLLCVFKNLFCSIFESAVSIITNFRINVFNENGKSGAARRLPDLPGVNQARPANFPMPLPQLSRESEKWTVSAF
ncbi:hypothetical protein [Holdemania sp. Marseille-P2844]|uniref:hypothetical protein n=1 Tax=Holdemania sp. Marseille-P2844 TaxID=1852366 RepID=UPI0013562B2E|nr:hypothetical protein [Holdemania sp. Marseille-P2844]